MGDLNPAIDFLDVLSDDIPKGETTVQSILLLFYDLVAQRGFVQKTRVYQTNAEKGATSYDLDTLTHNYFECVQV